MPAPRCPLTLSELFLIKIRVIKQDPLIINSTTNKSLKIFKGSVSMTTHLATSTVKSRSLKTKSSLRIMRRVTDKQLVKKTAWWDPLDPRHRSSSRSRRMLRRPPAPTRTSIVPIINYRTKVRACKQVLQELTTKIQTSSIRSRSTSASESHKFPIQTVSK